MSNFIRFSIILISEQYNHAILAWWILELGEKWNIISGQYIRNINLSKRTGKGEFK